MDIAPTDLEGVLVLKPPRHEDARGFLSETYSRRAFAEAGIRYSFVQDNHTLSRRRGTVRGLHFQVAPVAQAKLVRVARGAIYDVAVDVRPASPTFGRFASAELTAANGRQLLVPEGFAHGFCTLEADTEVLYKLSAPYSAAHERGVLWSDPALAIPWPVAPAAAIVSDRDRRLPTLAELMDRRTPAAPRPREA